MVVGMSVDLVAQGTPYLMNHVGQFVVFAVAVIDPCKALNILFDKHVFSRSLEGEFVASMKKAGHGKRLQELLGVLTEDDGDNDQGCDWEILCNPSTDIFSSIQINHPLNPLHLRPNNQRWHSILESPMCTLLEEMI